MNTTTISHHFQHSTQTYLIEYNFLLTFLSIIGMTLMEIGSSRHRNGSFIIIKNILTVNTTIIVWWFFGAAFSIGNTSNNNLIGTSFFTENSMNLYSHYNDWFKSFNQCLLSTLIASSVFSERGNLIINLIFSIVYSGFIFPIGYFWCMNNQGWLYKLGYIDISGSGIIHISGGVAGLVALIFLKSRKKNGNILKDEKEYFYSSSSLYSIGCFLFFYSNLKNSIGSDVSINVKNLNQSFSNNIISGFTSMLVCVFIKFADDKYFNVTYLFNGLLSGIYAIKSSNSYILIWHSFIIGSFSGVICFTYMLVLQKFIKKIDDSRFSFASNFAGGSVGIILLGFLHLEKGLFYEGGGKLLALQFLGLAVYIIYPLVCVLILFFILKVADLIGNDYSIEKDGFDLFKLRRLSFNYDSESAERLSQIIFKEKKK